MTQINVIGQGDLAAIETPSNPNTKDTNVLDNTSNGESTSNTNTGILSSNIENVESPPIPNTVDQDDLETDLEREKSQHNWKAYLSVESFKAMSCGSSIQFPWKEFIFHIFGSVFVLLLLFIIILFITKILY